MQLMILGAGVHQVPLIRKAHALGLRVITLDYLPDNVGHTMASASVNCSTMDIDGVLRVAQEMRVDGLMTFASDVASPTVAHVATRLGLPGPTLETVETMLFKDRFREHQHRHGLISCNFVAGNTLAIVREACKALSGPVVVKPVDASGSRGISMIHAPVEALLRPAFERAQAESRSGRVCIEEWVPGTDVSGDFFLSGGQIVAGAITQKFGDGMVPIGHLLPSDLPPAEQGLILSEVLRTCQSLGYADGPIDCDVRVAGDKVTIIEVNPRLGGNGIPQLVERFNGSDLIEMAIRFALGQPVQVSPSGALRRCASMVFGSPQRGTIESLTPLDQLIAAVPEVFDVSLCRVPSQRVPAFSSSPDMIGYVLFDVPAGRSYEAMTGQIRGALQINVRPDEEAALCS
jgi:biotin carboxylase